MLSVKSDSVVELALRKAEFERKRDLIQDQLVEDFEQDLEKGGNLNCCIAYCTLYVL